MDICTHMMSKGKLITTNKTGQVNTLIYFKIISLKRVKNQPFSKSRAEQQNDRQSDSITLLHMHAEGY